MRLPIIPGLHDPRRDHSNTVVQCQVPVGMVKLRIVEACMFYGSLAVIRHNSLETVSVKRTVSEF